MENNYQNNRNSMVLAKDSEIQEYLRQIIEKETKINELKTKKLETNMLKWFKC